MGDRDKMDSAKRVRSKVVSTIPPNHQRTMYGRTEVCARCGQTWPCESSFTGHDVTFGEKVSA